MTALARERGAQLCSREGAAAFMLTEMAFSLAIALVLLMVFSASVAKLRGAERQLADERAAQRRLEGVLLTMQNGGKVEEGVAVERLVTAAPAGRMWVRVSTDAGIKKMKESIVGLVPAAARGMP